MPASSFSGSTLVSSEDSTNWEGVPRTEGFWTSRVRATLAPDTGRGGGLCIWPTTRGLEYAPFASKPVVVRRVPPGYKQVYGERAWWVYLVTAVGGFVVLRALEALADLVLP